MVAQRVAVDAIQLGIGEGMAQRVEVARAAHIEVEDRGAQDLPAARDGNDSLAHGGDGQRANRLAVMPGCRAADRQLDLLPYLEGVELGPAGLGPLDIVLFVGNRQQASGLREDRGLAARGADVDAE